jgi:hypothetical protein
MTHATRLLLAADELLVEFNFSIKGWRDGGAVLTPKELLDASVALKNIADLLNTPEFGPPAKS